MKRYRVVRMDFDTRARVLTQEISSDWEPQVREQWAENKRLVLEGLVAQYGRAYAAEKRDNFVALGALPFSVVAFHNAFHSQARDAFVVGAYYPALTGICALGERVLNHLVLGLRDSFTETRGYKKIHRKHALDNWSVSISVLEEWSVLLPEAAQALRTLERLRQRAIHFRPEVDTTDRAMALDGIKLFATLVEAQFSAVARCPWFIPGIKGASYIRKEWERHPFIRLAYLPSCALVGPYHSLDVDGARWTALDDHEYEDREISDVEFAECLEKRREGPLSTAQSLGGRGTK